MWFITFISGSIICLLSAYMYFVINALTFRYKRGVKTDEEKSQLETAAKNAQLKLVWIFITGAVLMLAGAGVGLLQHN